MCGGSGSYLIVTVCVDAVVGGVMCVCMSGETGRDYATMWVAAQGSRCDIDNASIRETVKVFI